MGAPRIPGHPWPRDGPSAGFRNVSTYRKAKEHPVANFIAESLRQSEQKDPEEDRPLANAPTDAWLSEITRKRCPQRAGRRHRFLTAMREVRPSKTFECSCRVHFPLNQISQIDGSPHLGPKAGPLFFPRAGLEEASGFGAQDWRLSCRWRALAKTRHPSPGPSNHRFEGRATSERNQRALVSTRYFDSSPSRKARGAPSTSWNSPPPMRARISGRRQAKEFSG